ncbi:hypothetical protein [Deinococcus rubellus]|uniref:Uncharacterized protein n=1 Tax=Deinococcus rubellus TaxID=1889240 RepID=A0ABY5YI47_9DEIO|nr:hypothetical protein [Deinococcus rubellus]UWX64785.1 hypothetical protein N0D28_03740 [Deinococcus rubellus]
MKPLHLVTHRAQRRLCLSLARLSRDLSRRNTQPRCWSCRNQVAASSVQCAGCSVRAELP